MGTDGDQGLIEFDQSLAFDASFKHIICKKSLKVSQFKAQISTAVDLDVYSDILAFVHL